MTTPGCAICGCDWVNHQHDRDGLDCGTCGREVCPRYKAPNFWTRRDLLFLSLVIAAAVLLAIIF